MTDMTPSVTTAKSDAAQNRAAKSAKTLGLYDPKNEHDACGVGFIAQMKGVK